jgi:ABC-type glycerol-3-phosphate transport system substrate-binding protein
MRLTRRIFGAFALAAASLAVAGATPALAQKKLTLLTWNLPNYEEKFKGWIAEFEAAHPGFKVEWLDKKGTEWAAFYQTQLAAGTAPDIIDVQGALWAEYAGNDGLVDLTPYLAKNADVKARFDQDALKLWQYQGKQYLLPYYFAKTMLIYNKKLFQEAGLAGPPKTFDEMLAAADKITKSGQGRSGLISLNFDWQFWPIMAANGIELMNKEQTKATFNTPKAVELVQRLADATKSGVINNISWTGRWVEPNTAFAAGNIGMYNAHTAALFWIQSQASWANKDTLGVVPFPGGLGTPSAHGFAISKSTKHPDEAFAFIKIATSDKWQKVMAETFTVLTLNKSADAGLIGAQADPLKTEALKLTLTNLDKTTGDWPTPKDAAIKEALWPDLQAALLGQKDAKTALAQAEQKVNRVLSRR